MKIFDTNSHGIVDYMIVIFLLVSPTLFDLTYQTTLFVYLVGAIYFTLTTLTDFEYGVVKLIPVRLRQVLELMVGIAIMVSPFFLPHLATAKNSFELFFLEGLGIAVILIWFATDFSDAQFEMRKSVR
jgi:hypothetical protein